MNACNVIAVIEFVSDFSLANVFTVSCFYFLSQIALLHNLMINKCICMTLNSYVRVYAGLSEICDIRLGAGQRFLTGEGVKKSQNLPNVLMDGK
jgi:hypothetical protein